MPHFLRPRRRGVAFHSCNRAGIRKPSIWREREPALPGASPDAQSLGPGFSPSLGLPAQRTARTSLCAIQVSLCTFLNEKPARLSPVHGVPSGGKKENVLDVGRCDRCCLLQRAVWGPRGLLLPEACAAGAGAPGRGRLALGTGLQIGFLHFGNHLAVLSALFLKVK